MHIISFSKIVIEKKTLYDVFVDNLNITFGVENKNILKKTTGDDNRFTSMKTLVEKRHPQKLAFEKIDMAGMYICV
jgi:hypothetical protein